MVRVPREDPNPGELGDRTPGRPFAWVDDAIADADRDWVSAHHSGPTLLHRVESFRGFADEDFAALDQWLRAL